MRLKRAAVLVVVGGLGALSYVTACNFGVDLDGLFDGQSATDGGGGDGGVPEAGPIEAGIPTVAASNISAGDSFACGRRVDGTVMCWGFQDDEGRLGNGQATPSSVPVLVSNLSDATEVAAGDSHACAVRASGAVVCWGQNDSRQLGDGTTTASQVPRDVIALPDAVHLALGGDSSCALKKDGTVACWGDNTHGQLGDGTTTSRSNPAPVSDITGVTAIASANESVCAIVGSGDVYCWGNVGGGQTGQTGGSDILKPAKVPNLAGVTFLASGPTSSTYCAIESANDVKCWGTGGAGQLGNAQSGDSATPVEVVSVEDAVAVSVGASFACAARKSSVSCWGANDWRQLGIGDGTQPDGVNSPLPTGAFGAGVTSIAAGDAFACALSNAGNAIACWGSNYGGGLGRGTPVYAPTPLKVASSTVVANAGMGSDIGCFVDGLGALSCWGNNDEIELGLPRPAAYGTPQLIAAVTGVTHVAGGYEHTCAVVGGGNVQCWGYSYSGALGNGAANEYQQAPIAFQAPSPASDVGAGYDYTCALLTNGNVACAGRNDYDRLGYPGGGTNASPELVQSGPPVTDPDGGVDGGGSTTQPLFGGVTKISVGQGHACAIYNGTHLACWGQNSNGECGTSSANDTIPYPNEVVLPSAPTALTAGGSHSCALLSDGSVRCWGINDRGETGSSGGNGPSLRTPSLGGKQASDIAAGDGHTCAVMTDGTVMCWGAGTSGQIGNGLLADATSPAQVSGITTAKRIFAGGDHSCAVLADSSIVCWGDNSIGALGDGSPMATGAPADVVGY